MIGEFAVNPLIGGQGSAEVVVNKKYIDNPLEELRNILGTDCRFNPSMMFVVYIIFRISAGYAKNVDNISQLSSHVFTQEGYDLLHFSLKRIRLLRASSSVTAVYTSFRSAISALISL